MFAQEAGKSMSFTLELNRNALVYWADGAVFSVSLEMGNDVWIHAHLVVRLNPTTYFTSYTLNQLSQVASSCATASCNGNACQYS